MEVFNLFSHTVQVLAVSMVLYLGYAVFIKTGK